MTDNLTKKNRFSHEISADGLTLTSRYLTKDNRVLTSTVSWKDHETADEMHQVAEKSFEERAETIAAGYQEIGEGKKLRKLMKFRSKQVAFLTHYGDTAWGFPQFSAKRDGATVRIGAGWLWRNYEVIISPIKVLTGGDNGNE